MLEQGIFLGNQAGIPPQGAEVAGVELAEGRVQKFAPPGRAALDKAQMLGRKDHGGELARRHPGPAPVDAVDPHLAARALAARQADREPQRLLLPAALKRAL